jgi:nucleoside-diphosphate-sugar epimerase
VLITGATGFVGRHCLERLAGRAGEVHALVRPGTAPEHAGATFHEVNLLDVARVTEVVAGLNPSHLLHLAWVTEPGAFWTSAENVRWVEASLGLLRAFADAGGRRVVVAGTCAEYDWSGAGVCREGETPLRPASLYGVCKNALRELTEGLAGTRGLAVAWGRLFFLYGSHEHPRRLVASVARALLAGQPAPCSQGTQRRDFLSVTDAADAFVALLASDVRGAVNIASGEAVAVAEVVRRLGEITGRPDLLRPGAVPTGPNEPPLLAADVARLRWEVGWAPRSSLDQGLAQAVAWWKTRMTAEHAPARAA